MSLTGAALSAAVVPQVKGDSQLHIADGHDQVGKPQASTASREIFLSNKKHKFAHLKKKCFTQWEFFYFYV